MRPWRRAEYERRRGRRPYHASLYFPRATGKVMRFEKRERIDTGIKIIVNPKEIVDIRSHSRVRIINGVRR